MPPSAENKPWIWTSLGTAALIVLCCGVAPVVVIAGIEAARDSSTSGTGQGGAVVARASQHPSPRGTTPFSTPSPFPSPSAPASPSPSPSPQAVPQDPPPEEPAPVDPPREEPQLPPLQVAPPPFEPEPQPQLPPPAVAYPVPPQEIALPQPLPPPPAARIGDTIISGGLEFVVRGVQCGLTRIGTDARGQQAQGHFCVVTIAVRNVGRLSQSLLQSAQKVIGANGSEYTASALASLIANGPDNQNFLSGIDPGEEVAGFLVFDLPAGVNPAHVVLSGGIEVSTA